MQTLDTAQLMALAGALGWASGVRLYLVILLTGMAGFLGWVPLPPGLRLLAHPVVLGASGFMVFIEFFADKIPLVDHANDVLGTIVRPAAGALLFAASTGAVSGMQPVVAVIAGLLVAGTVHATKATLRPAVTMTTGGLGNPVVSTAEDLAAVVVSIGAIVLPILMALGLLILMVVPAIRSKREQVFQDS